jgi:DNA polymerase-3 subunit alpha
VGSFRSRFNSEKYEFKVERINLLETIKASLTKQLVLYVEPRHLSTEIISFLESNIRKFPGKTGLRINLMEQRTQSITSLYSIENGLEMNDELTDWLLDMPEMEVKVDTN